jgi:hypothetical protein
VRRHRGNTAIVVLGAAAEGIGIVLTVGDGGGHVGALAPWIEGLVLIRGSHPAPHPYGARHCVPVQNTYKPSVFFNTLEGEGFVGDVAAEASRLLAYQY